jgi:hypothetical protein
MRLSESELCYCQPAASITLVLYPAEGTFREGKPLVVAILRLALDLTTVVWSFRCGFSFLDCSARIHSPDMSH